MDDINLKFNKSDVLDFMLQTLGENCKYFFDGKYSELWKSFLNNERFKNYSVAEFYNEAVKYFKEKKKPIFVSFDGVEYFNYNDIVYGPGEWYTAYTVKEAIDKPNIKFFSKLRLLKKHSKQNKPIISRQQFETAIRKIPHYNPGYNSLSFMVDINELRGELGL
jgi:hypothetical protein